jgi:hypothetical protein
VDLVTSTTVQNRRQTVRELWSVSFSVDLVWLALALVALTLVLGVVLYLRHRRRRS